MVLIELITRYVPRCLGLRLVTIPDTVSNYHVKTNSKAKYNFKCNSKYDFKGFGNLRVNKGLYYMY